MIKRYCPIGYDGAWAGMEDDDYGDYVTYDDYENLEITLNELQKKYDRLMQDVGESVREG